MSAMPARPPRRQWWMALLSAGCALVVLAMLLVDAAHGPSPAPSARSAARPVATIAARPPLRLGPSSWERIALPTPVSDIQDFVVSRVDPATLFACTAHLPLTGPAGGAGPAPMTIWRTTDTGAHWTRYGPPLGSGISCHFSIAPDDPRRMALQVTPLVQGAQPCAHDTFYLSGDGGESWGQLPPHTSLVPGDAYYGWCYLQVTARHLFLTSSYAPAYQAPQVSLLERSDDDGITWTRADRTLDAGALFLSPNIGPGDTLAMPVVKQPEQAAAAATFATELWTSTDAGQTWRLASTLPDYPGTIMLAAPPRTFTAWPSPQRPFYALAQEQITSDLYRERVLQSGDGHHWSLLPPLSVPGVSDERRGIPQVLAALPDGRLAVWGADPRVGLPAAIDESMSAFWLWLWDPSARQWQVLSLPLNATASEGCGLCWTAQTAVSTDGITYLYVGYFDSEMSGEALPGALRVRLPRAG